MVREVFRVLSQSMKRWEFGEHDRPVNRFKNQDLNVHVCGREVKSINACVCLS